jgi:hypothetical protein
MREIKKLVEGFGSFAVRPVVIASNAARFARRIIAASGATANTTGRMSDRELQDMGLSPTRIRALNVVFASAEAQLGVVR